MVEMDKLPDEILIDILSRLSLKTLFQCRGVCTTWRTIILQDPYFANMHLTRASQLDLPSLVYTAHTHPGDPPHLYLLDFNSDNGQDHTLNIESTDPIAIRFEPHINFDTILSCDGLLCLCDRFNNPIYVCNPVTRDHVTLPQRWAQSKNRRFIPGFGFDATTKEYKVIRLMYIEKGGVASDLMAEVYTLGSGAWRSIGSVGCRRISFSGRTFSEPINIHGALHWIIELNFNPTIPEIVAWDVSDEKFRVVPCPEELDLDNDSYTMCLTTINKCLSIIYSNNLLESIDIWIMKDYNVKESWTEEVREDIPPWNLWYMESSLVKAAIIQRWCRQFDALNYRSSIDVVVKAIYSCEERVFKRVYETHFHRSGCIEYSTVDIATHVGSFVSVNRGNSWPDDVEANDVAARRVPSAKRKRR
ncbi:F-box protein At3g07870-like [Magnolia sinica]|uniref:F-box protein At3g07870-like n=1 Tax=Magnolia sinica TaxID=86752 RepID=UPI00265B1A0E|nr:F-box protein At3g07870-like [Magnolia sinica]